MVLAQYITDPPRMCAVICVCKPRYECRRRFDEWLDWEQMIEWLQTDGPGRPAHRDFAALHRAYIHNHDQNGIIAT